MFNHNLMRKARENRQRIVLPESHDPRILRATARILSQGLATPILLGERVEIEQVLRRDGIVTLICRLWMIVNTKTSPRRDAYAHTFHELRKHKGATLDIAHDHLLDVTTFGTMMVLSLVMQTAWCREPPTPPSRRSGPPSN
jgi:phosphate acetyltransferase